MTQNDNSAYRKNVFFDSDLALERRKADLDIPGILFEKSECEIGVWERITISSLEGERAIGRPRGNYDTLTVEKIDLLSDDEIENVANEISEELQQMVDILGVVPKKILVVGLGNPELTPDSIGPKSANLVNATMHLKSLGEKAFLEFECSEIAVFSPGVTSKSGIESTDAIICISERLNPDAIIAIDSLASRSAERLGSTIQISNTGVFPGSGIGNTRTPINESTLGVPVIAIGVPTVINARFLFSKSNDKIPLGLEEMFLSPKEIDIITNSFAKIISHGINQAFGIF